MSDIVNLRQFRKKKARDARDQQAEQNRILFGRTKAEKDFAREETRRAGRFLDMNRLERDKDRDEPDGKP